MKREAVLKCDQNVVQEMLDETSKMVLQCT